MEIINTYLEDHKSILDEIDKNKIAIVYNAICGVIENNKKIITFGNGGSASTSQHFITDWIKMVNVIKKTKIRGFSLVDNIGIITAYANDVSYDEIFSQQIMSLVDKDDLCIPISVSGNSKNVLLATEKANTLGANTFGFLGFNGGKLKDICKDYILVPSNDMQICEDMHLMIGHIIMKKLITD